MEDFCAYARATVAHFKDRVKYWEVYNEPNIHFWTGPKEMYPELVKAAYAAIKGEDPEATVIAISTSGVDDEFIQMCMDAGMPFDALGVHPYRSSFDEGPFLDDLSRASSLAGGRPIWITEVGWNTSIGEQDERSQALLLARCYLTSALSGVCRSIAWYDFHDDYLDPRYGEANFGVLRYAMQPKPAYRALATVCRAFGSATPRKREDVDYSRLFALDTDNALALWAPPGCLGISLPMDVTCTIESGTPIVTNLMGEPFDTAIEGNNLRLSLPSGEPIIIQGAKIQHIAF